MSSHVFSAKTPVIDPRVHLVDAHDRVLCDTVGLGHSYNVTTNPFSATCSECISKIPKTKPTLYCLLDDVTGGISISAYAADDPLFENNHIVLTALRATANTHHSVMNVFGNVLLQAGIELVED